jgi:hypothetical protein
MKTIVFKERILMGNSTTKDQLKNQEKEGKTSSRGMR